MSPFGLIPFFVVACVGCMVAVTDVRAFRVPNKITYPFVLAGIAYHGLTGGLGGLGVSLLGMAVGFAVLLFLHVPFFTDFNGFWSHITGISGILCRWKRQQNTTDYC